MKKEEIKKAQENKTGLNEEEMKNIKEFERKLLELQKQYKVQVYAANFLMSNSGEVVPVVRLRILPKETL